MVAFHPLWPVATVTAVDKSGTLQEKGGPGHNWSFLEEPESGAALQYTGRPKLPSGTNANETYQVKSSSKDGGVGYGSWLTAVQKELEAFHALSNGAQIHHILVLHRLLTGCQTLLEPMRTWTRRRGEATREQKRG